MSKDNDTVKAHKDFIERIIDKVSEKHMSPVPPDPVLIRLDKIIELLEDLAKNPRNRGVTG